MTAWRIDPLRSPSEIDDVLAVEEASFMNPWTREMYESELKNTGVSYLFLARTTTGGEAEKVGPVDEVAAFCSFWLVLDELHINNLAVLPAHRRKGAASALLSRVLREGRARGARRAALEVRESNDAARRLYERFGFRVAGVRRFYYDKPPEDALVLWRDTEEMPDEPPER
jgi:ribosomal-protein-alanine N-acetyltransferase